MDKYIKLVKEKLEEKNIEIYKEGFCDDMYNIVCGELMIFIQGDEVSVGFQANVRPEDAASYTLLLTETKLKIVIMESFILDSDFNVITGEEAHQLIKEHEQDLLLRQVSKEHVFSEILMNAEGFKC